MSTELYNLKWSEYKSTLASSVGSLLDDADFIDVTLACDGQSFSAHKLVLSACSSYFRKLLKRNPCKHPIIILRDVNANVLSSLIHFMYNGAVDVAHDLLSDFLTAAKSLQIRGLADSATNAPVTPKPPEHSEYEPPPPPKRQKTDKSYSKPAASYHQSTLEEPPSDMPVSNQSAVERLQRKSMVSIYKSSSQIEEDYTLENEIKEEKTDEEIEIVDDTMKTDSDEVSASGFDQSSYVTTECTLDESSQGLYIDDVSSLRPGDSDPLKTESKKCSECGKTFSTIGSKNQHYKNMHEEIPMDEWERCNMCPRSYKTRQQLYVHFRAAHGVISSAKRIRVRKQSIEA